jgi:hypothetical protein
LKWAALNGVSGCQKGNVRAVLMRASFSQDSCDDHRALFVNATRIRPARVQW